MKKFLVLGATILASWAFFRQIGKWIVLRPNVEKAVPSLPKADEEFFARNSEGHDIAAWWYKGNPGSGTVLLCHGFGSRHEKMAEIVAFLRKAGYAVLLLDFRAHGKSGGHYSSIGLLEGDDIASVLSEAERRGLLPSDSPLAAFGCSMGAAALVNSARRLPRIGAFILESMYYDFRKAAANHFKASFGIPDCLFIDAVICQISHESGYSFYQSRPAEKIKEVFPRPILLIHDTRDTQVLSEDFDGVVRNAPWAKVLTFQGAPHVGAQRLDPGRFEREFLDFLVSSAKFPPSPGAAAEGK